MTTATDQQAAPTTAPGTLTLPYLDAAALVRRLAHTTYTRPVLPILACALLDPQAGTVVSGDLENWTVLQLPAGAATGDACLLQVAELTRLLRAVKPPTAKATREATVTITAHGGELHVSCNGKQFTKTEVVNGVVEDYPSLPQAAVAPWATVAAADLAAALTFVEPAVGRERILPMLTCAHLSVVEPGTLAVAATDRYRLAYTTVAARDDTGATRAILLPHTAHPAVKALTGDIAIRSSADGAYVRLDAANGTVWVRPIEATFPAYQKLFPSDGHAWRTGRLALVEDAKAASVSLGKTDHTVVEFDTAGIAFRGCPKRPAENPVDVKDALHVGFNPHYLADGLAAFGGDTLTVTGQRPNKPWLVDGVRPDGAPGRYLIMPFTLPGKP